MGQNITRYAIRVPFPDEELFCFVLNSSGKVQYYESRADAELVAKQYIDACIIEEKYCGF